MEFGNEPGGSCAYISLFLSPSNPPKVRLGFDAVKNQKERARMQNHNQNGAMKRYFTLQSQVSQLLSR